MNPLIPLAGLVLALLPDARGGPVPLLPAPAENTSYTYLSEDSFTVQTKHTVEYVYVVGERGMEVGDEIWIEDPLFHGMRWSKWGTIGLHAEECTELATGQEASRSLVTASTTGEATLTVRRVDSEGVDTTTDDIHEHVYTRIILESGELVEGDELVVTFGDTGENELCGHEMPDRAFHQVDWTCYERLEEDAAFTAVEPVPTFDVHADDEVSHLLVVGPSQVGARETFTLKVTPLDYLGNPVKTWEEEVTLDEDHGGASHVFSEEDGGFHDFELSITDPGVHRVEVTGGELTGTSNPILVVNTPPDWNLYWGDIHVHHGHTYYTEDGERIDENHVYGRDIVGLDFACESQKALPTEIDGQALWNEIQDNCTSYTADGEYVVLLGFEWVGDLANGDYFHHNVYYDDCDGPIGDHDEVDRLEGEDGFYEWVRMVEEETGSRGVVIPHAPRFTGYDWDAQDNELRTLVEVYSEWGNNMEPPNNAASVPTALRKGNRLGFIAGSDNHDGWMGNRFSELNVPSGLGAVWADSLSRKDIWTALKERRTYGTTGMRAILFFEAEDGATVEPGTTYLASEPEFHWEYYGTDEVDLVRLLSVPIDEDGTQAEIYTESPEGMDVEGSYRWTDWGGTHRAVWLEVDQVDGEVTWSSPIWVTRDCDAEGLEDPAGRCDGDTADTGGVDTGEEPDSGDEGEVPPPGDGDTGGSGGGGCSDCATTGGSLPARGVAPLFLALLGILGVRRRGAASAQGRTSSPRGEAPARKPPWLKVRLPGEGDYRAVRNALSEGSLHTVCEEARCPNLGECWGCGTATLMILGDTCTRACRFCAVKSGDPKGRVDPREPDEVARAVERWDLRYVVLTSVDRDDLPDGGAAHFARVVRAIKERRPGVRVECLVPDFGGDTAAIEAVLASGLDVFAHNVETVERLQRTARDRRASFARSLEVLRIARERGQGTPTKSSLMLGLGETDDEIRPALEALRGVGVDLLTLGQYLRPTAAHLPVQRYVTPERFRYWKRCAQDLGFRYVASGPLVRSSYRAADAFTHRD